MGAETKDEKQAQQLIADVLEEYHYELDKAACDRCEQCGPAVMCSFHSVLSALQRHTWTNGAIERDTLRRRLKSVTEERDALQARVEKAEERLQVYESRWPWELL